MGSEGIKLLHSKGYEAGPKAPRRKHFKFSFPYTMSKALEPDSELQAQHFPLASG